MYIYNTLCPCSQDSFVCLSALHAGSIRAGEYKSVTIIKTKVRSNQVLLATISNRVVSRVGVVQ